MDSEKTLAQKELVESLNRDMQRLANYKTYLTKYVMEDKNIGSEHYDRASTLLTRLKGYLVTANEKLEQADMVWLGYQLDDLEAEICPKQ